MAESARAAAVGLGAADDARSFVAPPLSLYIHLPWCIQKCPYCDFNSHERRDDSPAMDAYIDALILDLEQALPNIWGRSVTTVFLGGGTPSLFTSAQIDRLLAAVRARVRLVVDAEITLEANPGTFEAERFAGFADAGVNRLSLGIQSFDDQALKRLGRVHDANQARRAIEAAMRQFRRVNLDLMFALPGQTMGALERELDEIRRWQPGHWSCYHLTLEPNTYFARFPPADLPDGDLAADMYEAVQATASSIGLEHYEVSAFARPGERCAHNVNYWQFGDYLGLGAGAHGKLSFPQRVIRQTRWRHPNRFVKAAADGATVESERVLDRDDLVFEFMLNALRLREGVPSQLFEQHCGLSLASFGGRLVKAVEDGLLESDPRILRATPLGHRFLNDLTARFLK